MKGYSIIIVTWNALHYLKEYLSSVVKTEYDNFEIILADNFSQDGTAKWVEDNYPEVRIVRLDQNYGYCGGNNRAAPHARYDKIIFLNNDVITDKDWLKGLDPAFEETEVAAAQPKLRAIDQTNHFEYAGAAGGFMDKYGFPFCQGRVFDHVEKDESQYDEATDIFWASGAALAIRKDVFTETGGFDEDFEFHMEEIDLCWRLQNQGYRIRYAPESVVYHLGGGSLPMGSPRKVYYNFRNSLFMLWKNYSAASLLFRFPVRLKLDIIAAYKALLSGNPKEWAAVAKAHLHFVSSLGRMNRKRKKLQLKRTKKTEPETMYEISIVWRHFARGLNTFREIIK